MKYCGALIIVEDVARARYFYETLLGQEVLDDYVEDIPFKGGFSIHKRAHFETLIGGKPVCMKSNAFELYFEDDAIDELEEKLLAANVEFIHGVVEQPWKQRVMRFFDYDKNIIEVGEKMEYTAYRLHADGMPLSEIMKALYMTKEKAEQSIETYKAANTGKQA